MDTGISEDLFAHISYETMVIERTGFGWVVRQSVSNSSASSEKVPNAYHFGCLFGHSSGPKSAPAVLPWGGAATATQGATDYA